MISKKNKKKENIYHGRIVKVDCKRDLDVAKHIGSRVDVRWHISMTRNRKRLNY